MTELIDWLRVQLDEDERVAREATGPGDGTWRPDVTTGPGPFVVTGRQDDDRWKRDGNMSVWTCDDPEDGCREIAAQWDAESEHIARHDPARVLAEVGAARRLLDLHAEPHECPEWDRALGETCTGYFGSDCPTVRIRALPYADRPGYRSEWRP